jgi:hypothetical protein
VSVATWISIADAGRAHLETVRDRQRRLPLERIDPTVPELRLVVDPFKIAGALR